MLDHVRKELERQLERLLEEAERPMTVEEIVPHLDPIQPDPNDVADVLEEMRRTREASLEREGSYWRLPTPVPVESIFPATVHDAARTVVELLRELQGEEGASIAAIVRKAGEKGIPRDTAIDVLTRLKMAGEAVEVARGRLSLAKK